MNLKLILSIYLPVWVLVEVRGNLWESFSFSTMRVPGIKSKLLGFSVCVCVVSSCALCTGVGCVLCAQVWGVCSVHKMWVCMLCAQVSGVYTGVSSSQVGGGGGGEVGGVWGGGGGPYMQRPQQDLWCPFLVPLYLLS